MRRLICCRRCLCCVAARVLGLTGFSLRPGVAALQVNNLPQLLLCFWREAAGGLAAAVFSMLLQALIINEKSHLRPGLTPSQPFL